MEKPKVYGHYTDQSALMSIFTNQKLWATNIKYLNDEQEFKHAITLILGLLKKTNFKLGDKDYDKVKFYIKLIKKEMDNIDDLKSSGIYTLSFSEKTDLLSQWRGYCKPGKGFCIEYDIEKIFNETKKNFPNSYLLECVYDVEKKEKALKELLNSNWSNFLDLFVIHETHETAYDDFLEDLLTEISKLASYFKHPSFSEEKEKRIVIIIDYESLNTIKFREGNFAIIPYLEIPADNKFVKNVVIGPTHSRQLSKKSLERFMFQCFGIGSVVFGPSIKHSDTPYRNW